MFSVPVLLFSQENNKAGTPSLGNSAVSAPAKKQQPEKEIVKPELKSSSNTNSSEKNTASEKNTPAKQELKASDKIIEKPKE